MPSLGNSFSVTYIPEVLDAVIDFACSTTSLNAWTVLMFGLGSPMWTATPKRTLGQVDGSFRHDSAFGDEVVDPLLRQNHNVRGHASPELRRDGIGTVALREAARCRDGDSAPLFERRNQNLVGTAKTAGSDHIELAEQMPLAQQARLR
jgi:hypothetical protein